MLVALCCLLCAKNRRLKKEMLYLYRRLMGSTAGPTFVAPASGYSGTNSVSKANLPSVPEGEGGGGDGDGGGGEGEGGDGDGNGGVGVAVGSVKLVGIERTWSELNEPGLAPPGIERSWSELNGPGLAPPPPSDAEGSTSAQEITPRTDPLLSGGEPEPPVATIAQVDVSPLGAVADTGVLLEAMAHTAGRRVQVQLLAAPGRAGASEAPPWSALVVDGVTMPYEDVTRVRAKRSTLEIIIQQLPRTSPDGDSPDAPPMPHSSSSIMQVQKRRELEESSRRTLTVEQRINQLEKAADTDIDGDGDTGVLGAPRMLHLRMDSLSEFDLWRKAISSKKMRRSVSGALSLKGGDLSLVARGPASECRDTAGKWLAKEVEESESEYETSDNQSPLPVPFTEAEGSAARPRVQSFERLKRKTKEVLSFKRRIKGPSCKATAALTVAAIAEHIATAATEPSATVVEPSAAGAQPAVAVRPAAASVGAASVGAAYTYRRGPSCKALARARASKSSSTPPPPPPPPRTELQAVDRGGRTMGDVTENSNTASFIRFIRHGLKPRDAVYGGASTSRSRAEDLEGGNSSAESSERSANGTSRLTELSEAGCSISELSSTFSLAGRATPPILEEGSEEGSEEGLEEMMPEDLLRPLASMTCRPPAACQSSGSCQSSESLASRPEHPVTQGEDSLVSQDSRDSNRSVSPDDTFLTRV